MLVGVLLGGVVVFIGMQYGDTWKGINVAQAKGLPEKMEQKAVENTQSIKATALPVLKVEVFPFEKNIYTHEYIYSTVNPEHSIFCEMQDQKYFGKNEDEYITKGDLVGCILKQQGDTEKELNASLKNALDILSIDDEFGEEINKDKEFEKLHNQWVQLRNKQCELSAKSNNTMNTGADRHLAEQSCINFWNKQYTMFLKTI